MTVAPARRAALHVIARMRKDEAYSGAALAAELAPAHLSPVDTALVTRLTYGVAATLGVLDEAVGRHVSQPLEPRVRDALRLGTYELLYSRAPAYAVVDQTVKAVRSVRPQAAGLANAVLRKLADEAEAFPWGDPLHDRAALARQTAHPVWIVDLFIEAIGKERALRALASDLEPAPTYVRLNPFCAPPAVTREALTPARPVSSAPDPDCFLLENPAAAFRESAPQARGWFAMDAAAQMAPRACQPRPGMRIADVGAGRGNKTLCLQSIAERHGGPAEIVAIELHPGKSEALRQRLHDSHVPAISVVIADGRDLEACFGPDAFDTVLVDAPCSGLGTLRRYPEKRWRMTEADVARLSEVQGALLTSAAAVVRQGGRVVYSTCTVAPAENEEVVESFLRTPSGAAFVRESLASCVPEEWSEFVTAKGSFQSWPVSGGPDGHFVTVLRRECREATR